MSKPKGDRIILFRVTTCPACGHEHAFGDEVVWVLNSGCYCTGCADTEGDAPKKVSKKASKKTPVSEEGIRVNVYFDTECSGCGSTLKKNDPGVWFRKTNTSEGGIFCVRCAR